MNLGQITLITPPDKLFNMSLSYLIVKPSNAVKEQFQTILSHMVEDVNVFMFDQDDYDIDWLLSVSQQVEVIIIDIDNCDPITKLFVTSLLAHPNSHYITLDDLVPYKLISKNRIYNLDWLAEQIKNAVAQDEEDDDNVSEE
jgi:hypothetical protein